MAEAMERKLRVFLCHASQDKPAVWEIYKRLKAEAWIEPWLDSEKLLPGMEWDLEIEKAVEAARVTIKPGRRRWLAYRQESCQCVYQRTC